MRLDSFFPSSLVLIFLSPPFSLPQILERMTNSALNFRVVQVAG